MEAPEKPWEKSSVLRSQARATLDSSLSQVIGSSVPSITSTNTEVQGAGRPPVPPRPAVFSNAAGFTGGYGSSHGLGFGGYGSYGIHASPYMGAGFSPYSTYNRLGLNATDNNPFIQQAESSVQGAFQSIESVVSAVSSISMMFESTYYALHNSFRAVLGVADQFSRLKLQLTHLVASFAAVKFIRWLYRRLLILIGLRKSGLPDDAWENALKRSSEEAQQKFPGSQKSSWPLVLFFAIAIGGPYMIWRMLCNVAGINKSRWSDGTGDHVVGECKYDFIGEREDELSVSAGQRITLAPAEIQPRLRQNDWLLASVDGKTGVVPASYIRILGTRKGIPQEQKLAHITGKDSTTEDS